MNVTVIQIDIIIWILYEIVFILFDSHSLASFALFCLVCERDTHTRKRERERERHKWQLTDDE